MKCRSAIYAATLTAIFFIFATISRAENAHSSAADAQALIEDLFGTSSDSTESRVLPSAVDEKYSPELASRARLADPYESPDKSIVEFILEPTPSPKPEASLRPENSAPTVDKAKESSSVVRGERGPGVPNLSPKKFEILVGESSSLPKALVYETPRGGDGPWTDSNSRSSITSRYAWSVSEEKGCAAESSPGDVRLKAQSLRDVLSRYSGQDDFYDTLNRKLCIPLCTKQGKGVMSGMAFEASARGGFSFVKEGGLCRYRLKKNGEIWPHLNIQRIVCSCVPV